MRRRYKEKMVPDPTFIVGDKVRMVPPDRFDSKYDSKFYHKIYRDKIMTVLSYILGHDGYLYYELDGGDRQRYYIDGCLELADRKADNVTNT